MIEIFQSPMDEPIKEALFRYTVISEVFICEHMGKKTSEAVSETAALVHLTIDKEPKMVVARTISRWLESFHSEGFDGLIPKQRTWSEDSLALPRTLVDFFVDQKTADPCASVPELIRRAEKNAMIPPDKKVDRTTVWRALQREGVDVTHLSGPKNQISIKTVC